MHPIYFCQTSKENYCREIYFRFCKKAKIDSTLLLCTLDTEGRKNNERKIPSPSVLMKLPTKHEMKSHNTQRVFIYQNKKMRAGAHFYWLYASRCPRFFFIFYFTKMGSCLPVLYLKINLWYLINQVYYVF